MTSNYNYYDNIEISIYKTKINNIFNKLISKQIEFNNQLINDKQNNNLQSEIYILIGEFMNLFYEIRYVSINRNIFYKIYSNINNCNNGCKYTKPNINSDTKIINSNTNTELCLCMLLTPNTYLWLNKKLNRAYQLKFMQIIARVDPNIYSYLPIFYYKNPIYNKVSTNIDIKRWISNLEVNQGNMIINELFNIGLEFYTR